MIELLQKSNETSDLQILKEQVNKNNNRPMDQLQNKSWNLRTGLLKSSHFYTNYGSSPSSFARGITAFQGYCLNDFQSNAQFTFQLCKFDLEPNHQAEILPPCIKIKNKDEQNSAI